MNLCFGAFRGRQNDWPVMTVHADVTSHESQQEYDRNCFPQFSGG